MRADVRFAYVDFASEELQQAAVRLSEGMLEGRRVLIKLGTRLCPVDPVDRG